MLLTTTTTMLATNIPQFTHGVNISWLRCAYERTFVGRSVCIISLFSHFISKCKKKKHCERTQHTCYAASIHLIAYMRALTDMWHTWCVLCASKWKVFAVRRFVECAAHATMRLLFCFCWCRERASWRRSQMQIWMIFIGRQLKIFFDAKHFKKFTNKKNTRTCPISYHSEYIDDLFAVRAQKKKTHDDNCFIFRQSFIFLMIAFRGRARCEHFELSHWFAVRHTSYMTRDPPRDAWIMPSFHAYSIIHVMGKII